MFRADRPFMNLLAIETSTEFCSLAICVGGQFHATHVRAGQRHAEMVLGAVASLMADAGLDFAALDGVAFGKGPGSFTGLRIACGVAQGLALARDIGVVGVCTLEALAEECDADAAITCLDARMGEVYLGAYRRRGAASAARAGAVASAWDAVLAPGLYSLRDVPALAGGGWTGCGSGFAVYGEVLATRYAANMVADVDTGAKAAMAERVPTAGAVLRLALPVFAAGGARDAAEALPLYLRDKVALKKGEQ